MKVRRLHLSGLLLVLQPALAQQVSFHITPLRPVGELRTEALNLQPPIEQGPFLKPDLVELTTLDPTIKLDIRYATTNNLLGTPLYTRRAHFSSGPRPRPSSAPIANSKRRATALSSTMDIAPGTSPKSSGTQRPTTKRSSSPIPRRARSTIAAAPWTSLCTI